MNIPLTCSHINEDKRKTKGQMHMFEMLRDFEGCPVSRTNMVFLSLVTRLTMQPSIFNDLFYMYVMVESAKYVGAET